MDDSPYLHYQVRYIVHYLQPQVGQKVKAKIQNIQQGHISLTIEGRLTAIIPINVIDTSKFSIEQVKITPSEDEENLDMPDDEESQIATVSKFKITSIKKGKSLEVGSKVKVVITEMVVNQGNMVLYVNLA